MSNLSINRESFITIQGWMVTDLELTGKDLMVYAVIYGFSQNDSGKFTGSQNYLADWIGCTRRTINDVLKGLVDKELIVKDTYEKNGMTFCEYRVNDITRYRKIIDDNFTPREKISHPPVKNLHTPCEEISHNNIENTIDDNIVPPIIPQKKKGGKKGILSAEVIMNEVDKRPFSTAIREKLVEWVEYKEERNSAYKTIKGLNMQLSQLENTIKKYGEHAVLQRIDEAMSREWVGWNFDTIDAFSKDRPYVQNLDRKPKYKEFKQDAKHTSYAEEKKNFQEATKQLRDKLKS